MSFARIIVRPKTPPPCPCAQCRLEHRTIPGFCDAHRARLAEIRESWDDNRKLRSVGNGIRKKALAPRCCLPECAEPRGLGERYCVEHRDLEDE